MASQTTPPTWPNTTSQDQSNTTTSSTTTLISTSPYKPTAEDNVQTTTPSAPTDRATLIGGVVGGAVGVVVVVILVAVVVVWKRKKERLRNQPKVQTLAFTLPETEPQTRPIPSPRPDFTKRGPVNISDLSTSNVYEDIDGQNTQGVLTRLPSTHEGEYLELIGPDVPQYAQSTKRNTSGKASVKPNDSHTYQNVEDDVEHTAKSEYYVNEEISKT